MSRRSYQSETRSIVNMNDYASGSEQPPPYQELSSDSEVRVPTSDRLLPIQPPPRPALRSGDVIVIAMGVTGAGKSTFVSLVSPDEDVEIGHDLRSSE